MGSVRSCGRYAPWWWWLYNRNM